MSTIRESHPWIAGSLLRHNDVTSISRIANAELHCVTRHLIIKLLYLLKVHDPRLSPITMASTDYLQYRYK